MFVVAGYRDDFRWLLQHGFTPAEAGNMLAFRHGLWPTATPWTPHQIAAALELRVNLGGRRPAETSADDLPDEHLEWLLDEQTPPERQAE